MLFYNILFWFEFSRIETLIWMGFLVIIFPVDGGITPCLNLIRITKTWNLARKYIRTLILMMLVKSEFFGRNSTFTQSNSMRAVLNIF